MHFRRYFATGLFSLAGLSFLCRNIVMVGCAFFFSGLEYRAAWLEDLFEMSEKVRCSTSTRSV
jgi:hypothetical protein